MSQKITPNLWFDMNAEEAANFYVDLFDDGRILNVARYPEGSPGPAGEVMTVEWELNGQKFVGINGGPQFQFSEAVSFMISCKDQEEVDYYWDRLTADGGKEGQCGWLSDRFGLAWQVVPEGMDEVFSDPDPAKAERSMAAMMKMKKLDIAELRAAAEGVPAG
ncbi:MAG TPA: VOC family protein [Solirubrobacterales bacterium]|jgi:predicted 3-demethylubiquinone-9 3-methyltransferase (glyoxalase superfamily)|nr:VOC family protein [Solirubrobacterales bacterium]